MQAKQKRDLRARAHHLKPVVIIGQHGVTEAVLAEIDNALSHHELIKVRINADTPQIRRESIDKICARQNAELVQQLGHIAILYRENPED